MSIRKMVLLVLAILCFGLSGLAWWDMETRNSTTGNYARMLYLADMMDETTKINALAFVKLQQAIRRDQSILIVSLLMGMFFLARFLRKGRKEQLNISKSDGMRQTAKIIGLQYQKQVYYAMFINTLTFDNQEEIRILTEYAGITPYRAAKNLLIAPMQEVSKGGEVIFTNMPGTLTPREPYCTAFQFVRDRWDDIHSGAVLNADMVLRPDGKMDDYIVRANNIPNEIASQ